MIFVHNLLDLSLTRLILSCNQMADVVITKRYGIGYAHLT